jgi:hypothetical protein
LDEDSTALSYVCFLENLRALAYDEPFIFCEILLLKFKTKTAVSK